jgi:hypothetical protein
MASLSLFWFPSAAAHSAAGAFLVSGTWPTIPGRIEKFPRLRLSAKACRVGAVRPSQSRNADREANHPHVRRAGEAAIMPTGAAAGAGATGPWLRSAERESLGDQWLR